MAESPVSMDLAFSVPGVKSMSNGHTKESHDSHMTNPTTTTNGIEPSITLTEDNESGSVHLFEDSFVTFDTNGPVVYDDEDDEDDFVDPLELARIRHLSTIVEGHAENSNSSSDNEDSDYIRLNEVCVGGNDKAPTEVNVEGIALQQNGSEVVISNMHEGGSVEATENNDDIHDYNEVPVEEHTSLTLSTTGQNPSASLTVTGSYDYDQAEINFEATSPQASLQSTGQAQDYVNITIETNAPTNVEVPEACSPTPDPSDITPQAKSPDLLSTTLPNHDSDTVEASAPSPHGFLAVLTDALAEPPGMGGNEGGEDSGMVKGTLSPPGEWLLPDDEMYPMDSEQQPLFNFLPLITPPEQCSITDLPMCLDIPTDQYQRSNSSSSDYVCLADIAEQEPDAAITQASSDQQSSVDADGDSQTTPSTSVASTDAAQQTEETTATGSIITPPKPPARNSHATYVNVSMFRESAGQHEMLAAVPQPQAISEQGTGSTSQEEASNLDRGVRTPGRHGHLMPLGPTLSSPGEGSPVRLRQKTGDSPITRRKNITSSPVQSRRAGELGILQPLSPEHGMQLTDQYDFLRRTLSHSHRRYSTRRRPNRKRQGERASEAKGNGEDPGLETSLAPTEVSMQEDSPVQRRWRDILISTETPPTRASDGYVDHHGRTYYMDHTTRTIAFDDQRRHSRQGHTSSDLETRREMLERRYRSLNRSFRRNERSQASSRRGQQSVATPAASSNLEDNMSLTLTREEADAMIRREGTPPSSSSRSKSKKKRNTTGSGRRWPFSRKSSKSISQQSSTSGDDDIIVISPNPITSDLEFRIPDSPSRVRSSNSPPSITDSLDSGSSRNVGVTGSRDEGVALGAANEQGVTPEQRGDVVTELPRGEAEIAVARHTSPEVSDLDRHDSIVRSSWLAGSDRTAAQVARRRASSRRRVSRDSDDVTNEMESSAIIRSSVVEPHTPDSPLSPMETGPLDEDDETAEERQLGKALANSPTLKFITRKDLFSFLSSAGEAGKAFIASRALMELVQRIRSDNFLLQKYQHSRHLVGALNRFADEQADLPDNWEKKLNQQGKVFFIDHKHKVTTFIDPRLPLPNTVFTYNTRKTSQSAVSTRRSLLFTEEPEVRPHHVTHVSSSSSLDVTTPTSTEPTTPTVSEPPTPSSATDGPAEEGAPPTYEAQVVAFFRKPDVVDIINSRYQRGVRPPFRNIIEEVRLHGIPALERIQMSGSIAAYELALVLSLFEEDIGRIQLTTQAQPVPSVLVNAPKPTPQHPATITKNTLQRKKEAFSTKLQHFKIMMVRMGFSQGSRLKFNIRRDHLLEDAYEHVMKSDIKQLQTKRLNIAFKGEEGLDYGGPSREFFFLLSREIFNPYYGLFEYSANDTYTVQVNPTSEFLQNSLDWFRFAGRVVGLVIVQGFLLDAFFTRTVYKTFLSRPPTLKDLEALEPAFYNSLLWIRENDPEPLDLTFTVEEEAFGELRSHQLKEGGLDLPVTEDNKEEYITLMLKWRLDRGVAKQMEVLKKGFAEVIPPHLLVDFDAHELEFITAGTVEIDVEDWKTHTEYRNGYHPSHPVIIWFWKAVEAFENEQRLRLLQFVTGTSSVPFEGFKALRGSNGPKRFTIDYYNDMNAFPRSHTCFNRIDLPPYSSYDVLHDKLLFAVQEGGGFGIE